MTPNAQPKRNSPKPAPANKIVLKGFATGVEAAAHSAVIPAVGAITNKPLINRLLTNII